MKKNEEVILSTKFKPRFWEDANQRNSAVKTIKRRFDLLVDHTGADSAQKEMLVQRAVFISVMLETMERSAAEKGEINIGKYTQMVNTLIGLLGKLGLERHIKKAGSLDAYLKQKEEQSQ